MELISRFKKYDEKIDNYFNNISVPNYKNTSNAMKGIMHFGGAPESTGGFKEDRQSVGLFPNLNYSKKECKNSLYNFYRNWIRNDGWGIWKELKKFDPQHKH